MLEVAGLLNLTDFFGDFYLGDFAAFGLISLLSMEFSGLNLFLYLNYKY